MNTFVRSRRRDYFKEKQGWKSNRDRETICQQNSWNKATLPVEVVVT
jgi:hypothetical protein